VYNFCLNIKLAIAGKLFWPAYGSISVLTLRGICSKLLVSKSKTKTYKITKIVALCDPKGCKSGQSKPKGSKRYIFSIKERIYYPRLQERGRCGVLARSFHDRGRRMTKITKIIGVSSIILLLILLTTNPKHLPSTFLIIPFALVFAILSAAVAFVVKYFGASKTTGIKVGLASASMPVLLLVMKSLGQLTIRDVLSLVVLFVVAYFYTSRFGLKSAS
jgi:hypothetical protein